MSPRVDVELCFFGTRAGVREDVGVDGESLESESDDYLGYFA